MACLETIEPIWLVGLLLLQIPFLIEVVRQIQLQKKLLPEVPREIWKILPPFPVGHKTTLFASVRFQRAFWKYVYSEYQTDSEIILGIKHKIRASVRRKIAFAVLDLLIIGFVFVTQGKRF